MEMRWKWIESILVLLLIFALIVLFAGEPDLMDAIIQKVRNK